ncbi:MAG: aminomethyltransferase family protein, partial [Pseudomonadota bacterium]
DFEHVGREVKTVREGVGIMEISGFSKFIVDGEGAEAWLDRMLAAKLPKPGRMTLAPMLKEDGKLIGDFSLANLGDGRWFLAGSGIAEDYYMRWFLAHLPEDGSVRIDPLGLNWCGVSIAGPKARDLLHKVSWRSVAHEDFKFMAVREMEVGHAPCLVGRVTFTGDLGYEIWMKTDYCRYVFEHLLEAGEEFGIKPFGLRALNALRFEKNWSGWGREYRPIYGPVEAGLDRFVAYDKASDFIGKDAALTEQVEGGKLRLLTFRVDAKDADAMGDEPIWRNGDVVGWITSGGYAHAQGLSMAQGYVPKEYADEDEGWATEILGEKLAMTVQRTPLFDANASRMRS